MSHEAYELIAQTARYIFAALMLLIVIRAGRNTLIDSRRAAKLRRLSPMTGLIGELVVLEGDERARKGMRYPVIREGAIGTSRSADIRIRHSSIRRRHAIFQMTEDGLHIRGHAGTRIRNSHGEPVREITLGDGANFGIGRVHLLLVLSEATASEEIRLVPKRLHISDEDLFDVDEAGEFFPDDEPAYHGNPTLMQPRRTEAQRRDEFRRIRREVKDANAPHPARRPAVDPYDDPFSIASRPGTDRIRRTSDSFDGIRRPSGSNPTEGIRRKPRSRPIDADSLFDTDNDF